MSDNSKSHEGRSSVRSLFERKPIELITQEEGRSKSVLSRHLGKLELLSLGIGGVIGAGIFVLSGIAAKEAGPAVIVSFLLAGIACAFSALCYSELAALIPAAGSAYSYAYATLGEGIAWFIGWNQVLRYTFTASMIASGWSGYVIGALHGIGVDLPVWLSNDPWSIPGGFIDLPATLLVIAITLLVLLGIRKSTRMTQLIVAVELTVLIVVILLGMFQINPANWDPFAPFGSLSVISAVALVFLAYAGFENVTTVAEEARNPQRDLPICILGSLGVAIVLYVGVIVVLTGMVPFDQVNIKDPIADAFGRTGLQLASTLIAAGAIAALTSVMVSVMIAQPRIVLAMARDGLLPRSIARISRSSGAPMLTTLAVSVAVGLGSAFVPIEKLAHLNSINILLLYALVCISALLLRYRQPALKRPYRAPLFPWIPLLGAVICIGLTLRLSLEVWCVFFAWTAIGLAIYFGYSRRHSRLIGSHNQMSNS